MRAKRTCVKRLSLFSMDVVSSIGSDSGLIDDLHATERGKWTNKKGIDFAAGHLRC